MFGKLNNFCAHKNWRKLCCRNKSEMCRSYMCFEWRRLKLSLRLLLKQNSVALFVNSDVLCLQTFMLFSFASHKEGTSFQRKRKVVRGMYDKMVESEIRHLHVSYVNSTFLRRAYPLLARKSPHAKGHQDKNLSRKRRYLSYQRATQF